MSTLFHLMLLAPFILVPLKSKSKHGLKLTISVWLISLFIPLITRFVLKVPTFFEVYRLSSSGRYSEINTFSYFGPWNYIFPLVTGILLGYLLENYPKINLINKIGHRFVTLTTFVLYILCLYWKRHFYHPDYAFDAIYGYELHIYLVINKIILLAFYFSIILSCSLGYLSKVFLLSYLLVMSYLLAWPKRGSVKNPPCHRKNWPKLPCPEKRGDKILGIF